MFIWDCDWGERKIPLDLKFSLEKNTWLCRWKSIANSRASRNLIVLRRNCLNVNSHKYTCINVRPVELSGGISVHKIMIFKKTFILLSYTLTINKGFCFFLKKRNSQIQIQDPPFKYRTRLKQCLWAYVFS